MEFINKIKKETKTNILFYITILFVIFTGVFLRAALYLKNLSFWHDEALLALNIYNPEYLDYFHGIQNVQMAPPLFMIISKFLYTVFNADSDIYLRDLILRIFPFFSGILTLIVFGFFINKALQNKFITLFSTSIIAFNIAAINYSQEFKQYSSDLLISTVIFFIFYFLDFKNTSSKNLGLVSVFLCICLFTSYTSIFIITTGLIYLIGSIIKNKTFDKTKLISFFIPIICCLLSFFAHCKEISTKYFELMQWHWTYIERSFFTIDNFIHMFPYKTNGLIGFIPEKLILPILILGIIILFFKNNKKLVFLTLTPIIFCIIACFIKKYPYEQRLILFLLPNFAIILSQFAIFLKDKTLIKIITSIVFISFSIYQYIIPIETKDIHYSNARNYAEILINKDVKMENIIAISSLCKYYFLPKFKTEINVYNDLWKGFNKESFQKKLDELPYNEEVYLLAPREMPDFYEDSITKIKEYLENNKQYKILETITTNNDKSYLIRFIKI